MFKAPKNCRLYVNFFEWNRIPAPETDNDPIPAYGTQLEDVNKSANNSESMVNMAFHPNILKSYGRNSQNLDERDMLVELAFRYIEDQNNIEIDKNRFKILNENLCFGDPNLHISKLKNEHGKKYTKDQHNLPLDDVYNALEKNEMPDQENILNNLIKLNINPNNKGANSTTTSPTVSMPLTSETNSKKLVEEVNPELEIPKYEIEIFNKKSDSITEYTHFIQIKIYLNHITSINECDLSIEDLDCKIKLVANKNFYKPLDISLIDYKSNYSFNLDDIDAKFLKKSSILKLNLNAKKI